ncbi:MAG: hypothetical protein NTY77_05570 [Elusimicrobia bacterium]|nr:hypothetical protein [Elusimicrobiota bacterium]
MIEPAPQNRHELANLLAQMGKDLLLESTIEKRAEAAKAAAARKDILAWGALTMPEKFFMPFCHELHDYFVDIRHAEASSTEAPRGHSKTTIKCTLIPMFQALEEPESYDYYLNVQATGAKAVAVNTAIKSELEENELLRYMYGEQVGDKKWTDQIFVTRGGIVFQALGAGQSIRGTQYRNRRPKYIVIDDLYDEEDLENPEGVERKNRWFWGSLYPARAKGMDTAFHLQGTPISDRDVLWQMSKLPGVLYRQFAALKPDGTPLWPELNSKESLAKDRIFMGSIAFDRELQMTRRDETAAIVKASWLKDWELDPAKVVFDKNQVLDRALLCCDPSIGKKLTNDPTAIAMMFRIVPAGMAPWWFIDALGNELLSLNKRVAKIREFAAAQPEWVREKLRIRVEAIAGFMDFPEALRSDPVCANYPIEEIDHVPDKISNLTGKSVHFENGKVRISTRIRQDLRTLAFDQLTTNYPSHDDVRDAILLGLDKKNPSGMWS